MDQCHCYYHLRESVAATDWLTQRRSNLLVLVGFQMHFETDLASRAVGLQVYSDRIRSKILTCVITESSYEKSANDENPNHIYYTAKYTNVTVLYIYIFE